MEDINANVRKYIVRLFKTDSETSFYRAIYYVPPVVPRAGETIGLAMDGEFQSYTVVTVFYEFPDEDDPNMMLIGLFVEPNDRDDIESGIESVESIESQETLDGEHE